jgi:hypothetical protein
VEVLGVPAGLEGEADDGVLVHPGQATGLADADPFLEVGQDGDGLVIGQTAVKQGAALAFAEAVLAGTAGQVAALLGGAITEGNTEVALPALAVVRALRILAAEVLQVVHGRSYRKSKTSGCHHASVILEKAVQAGKIDKTPPNIFVPWKTLFG